MNKVEILYEDAHLIVVVKPPGMPSQPERTNAMDMVSYLKNYLVREKKVKGIPYIGVVHRLDRPVGGVMVYAKSQQAAAGLSEQIQQNKMHKAYHAVLTGTLPHTKGILEDYLLKDGRTNMSKVVSSNQKGAKLAKLEYEVLKTWNSDEKIMSLVNIHLITGRHHQIRVQMAHAGAGLAGDMKYNIEAQTDSGRRSLALFSWSLSFMHPVTKKILTFDGSAYEKLREE